ncbi:MAG: GNAT family N-acetyltransferase [Rubricella sp.]
MSSVSISIASTPEEIAGAAAIDTAVLGGNARAAYIRSVAERSGLRIAAVEGALQGFACLDDRYFFGKPFVSLLVVAPEARRRGIGASLLAACAQATPDVWTSTNRSNGPMRALLDAAGWRYCGEVSGLDEGDPERFYRAPGPGLDGCPAP